MPAQAALQVNDGLATPVARTFSVFGVRNGVADFAYKIVDLIEGYIRIQLNMIFPKKHGDPVIHTMKVKLPTVATETINGITYQKVVRSSTASVTVYAAPDATAQELKDLMAFVQNLCYSPTAGYFGYQVVNKDPTT